MIVGAIIATTKSCIRMIPPLDKAKGIPRINIAINGIACPMRMEIINQNYFIRLSQHLFPSNIASEMQSFFFNSTRLAVSWQSTDEVPKAIPISL